MKEPHTEPQVTERTQKPEPLKTCQKTLTSWLKQIALIEADIESFKISLSLMHDFNLVDAFKLFDVHGIGFATAQDFVHGFRHSIEFHTFCLDDIHLIFHRANRRPCGRVTYQQFCELLLPKSQEHAARVIERCSLYQGVSDRTKWFNRETRISMQNFFKVLTESEKQIEQIRRQLQ